jgi:hypothetical protein
MRRMALGTGLALLLAACGGGGPSGTQVQVSLVDGLDNPIQATAAAYRVGNGPFQALIPTGPGQYRFTVPSGENRYTVVFRCPYFGALASQVQAVSYELTLAEATSFKARCPLAYAGPEANLNQTDDNTSGQDFAGGAGQAYSATTFFFGAPLLDEGGDGQVNDLPNFFRVPVGQNREVAIFGQIGSTYYFGRALVNVTSTTTGIPPIAVSPVVGSFATTDPAQAYFLGKEVRIFLGSGTTLPRPSSDPGDLYELLSFSGAQARLRRVPANALASPVDTAPPSLSFSPSVPTPGAGSLPTFQGLTASGFAATRPLRGYLLELVWSGGAFWQHLVGQGVLGAATSYALPDPTGVAGLEALKPTSGDFVNWQAVALGLDQALSQVLGARPIPQGIGPFDALNRHLPLDLEAAAASGSYTQP